MFLRRQLNVNTRHIPSPIWNQSDIHELGELGLIRNKLHVRYEQFPMTTITLVIHSKQRSTSGGEIPLVTSLPTPRYESLDCNMLKASSRQLVNPTLHKTLPVRPAALSRVSAVVLYSLKRRSSHLG